MGVFGVGLKPKLSWVSIPVCFELFHLTQLFKSVIFFFITGLGSRYSCLLEMVWQQSPPPGTGTQPRVLQSHVQ